MLKGLLVRSAFYGVLRTNRRDKKGPQPQFGVFGIKRDGRINERPFKTLQTVEEAEEMKARLKGNGLEDKYIVKEL